MYLGNYYFDGAYGWTYILVLITFFAAAIASRRVNSVYSKFDKVRSTKGLTAEQAAQRVLDHYGVKGVTIQPIAGNLTDNFNPQTNIISLSESVYGHTSIAAIGVACHEAGHAAQHAEGYVPIKLRNAVVPVTNFGSRAGLPIAILGVVLASATQGAMGYGLVYFGLLLYAFITIFQFITLPVELNASRRALKVIDETGMLEGSEYNGAKAVLTAAAMTYVVAAASALASLLRYAVILLNRSDRR